MKYVITIDERFWPLLEPDWECLTDERRRYRMERFMDALDAALKDGSTGAYVTAKLYDLLTDEAKEYITISPLVTSEGIARIQEEREEQRAKHGFSDAHDDALDGSELEYAAAAVLTEDPVRWPASMDKALFLRATEKGTLGRLAVAGALIAAEMDRIDRELARQGGSKPVGPTLPPEGTRVQLRAGVDQLLTAHGMSQNEAEHLSSLGDTVFTVHHAELRGEAVWVSLSGHGPLVPLACCTIIHNEQPTI